MNVPFQQIPFINIQKKSLVEPHIFLAKACNLHWRHHGASRWGLLSLCDCLQHEPGDFSTLHCRFLGIHVWNESFQFRMSQVNRMGLDPKKEPDVFRTFLTKYLDSLAGEDSGLDARQRNARRLLEDYEKVGNLNPDHSHWRKCIWYLSFQLGQNNITWADELAYIQGNLSEAGIEWDETSEPFIMVKGTAQVCSDRMHCPGVAEWKSESFVC